MQKILFLLVLSVCINLPSTTRVLGQGIGDPNRTAETGRYNISGKVYGPDGRPAIGIKIELTGTDFINLTTVTDQDGSFLFAAVPGGNYTVTTRSKEFQTETEPVTIERAVAGSSFKIVINLRSQGSSAAYASPMLAGVPADAVGKLQKGMEKATAKDNKGAIALYDQAIAAYPNFAAAYYQKGTAYLALNDLDKALEAFVQAIQIKPDYLEAKYSYGYTEYLKKNYEIAAAAFDDVITQKINMPEAYMYHGISLFHLGNIDAAEKELKQAIASPAADRVALAHRFLGGLYMQKKQNAAAADELQKYLDLVPKTPDADKIRATIASLRK
jgi:Tfp pilus assembly protein PilF